MPNEKQDLTNHRKVAVACKNYTDKEIKASEERILSIVARNNVSYIDHTNEATYRFTAPANSKLLMLQSIAGNSNKIAPSTPSDDTLTALKTIPTNTYTTQVNYVGGMSYKYNQLAETRTLSYEANMSGATSRKEITTNFNFISGHKYLIQLKQSVTLTTATRNIPILLASGGIVALNNYGTAVGTLSLATMDNQNLSSGYKNCIYTCTTSISGTLAYWLQGNDVATDIEDIQTFDLTSDFGAGNEPSTVSDARTAYLARGVNIDEYNTYSLPTIRDTKTTNIKATGANLMFLSNINQTTTNGITYKVENGVIYLNGTANEATNIEIPLLEDMIMPVSLSNGGNGVIYFGNSYTGSLFVFKNDGTWIDSWGLNEVNRKATTYSTLANRTIDSIIISISNGSTITNGTIKPMVVNNGNTNQEFTYVLPITKSIPASVQALDGYGSGLSSSLFNYVDLISLKFKKYVGSYTFTGQETCSYSAEYGEFTFTGLLSGIKSYNASQMPTIFMVNYEPATANGLGQAGDWHVTAWSNLLRFKNSNYTSADSFVATLVGKTIYYELSLSSVVETDISSYIDSDFKKFITNNNYTQIEMVNEYNANLPSKVEYYGTIIHSLATAVKQDGFNVFNAVGRTAGTYDSSNPSFSDEKYYGSFSLNGNYYSTQGVATLTSTSEGNVIVNVVNVGYGIAFPIKVIAGATYHIDFTASSNNTNVGYFFVDYSGNKTNGSYSNTSYNVNIPNNCEYLVLVFGGNSTGAHTFSNICINISNQDLNGTYKPYKAPITRLLPNSEAKYSWGITTGVRNTRVFCDDECNPVNEGQLDVNSIDLGNLNWEYQSEYQRFRAVIDIKGYNNNETANVLINKYTVYSWNSFTVSVDMAFSTYALSESVHYIYIRDTNYTDAQTFKTVMSGRYLYYEKNATGIETLDDFDFSFDCEEGDTFTIIGCENLQCYATYSFLIKEAKSNE